MSVSDKQLAANRCNAQHSTGPTSEEGKQRSAMNALIHGGYSNKKVLPWESQAEFDQFERELLSDLQPECRMEKVYADRVIMNAWRLQRVGGFEVTLIEKAQTPQDLLDALTTISLFETRMERSLDRSLNAFYKWKQKHRVENNPEAIHWAAREITIETGPSVQETLSSQQSQGQQRMSSPAPAPPAPAGPQPRCTTTQTLAQWLDEVDPSPYVREKNGFVSPTQNPPFPSGKRRV
jgi:hypothetical protein